MNEDGWINAVICEGNYELLDVNARALGNKLADEVSSTQIRSLFGTIKRLEFMPDGELENQLTMLRPRLANAAARVNNEDFNWLKHVLTKASEQAQKAPRERTQRLVDLMEAILCYSRAGRESKGGMK